MLEILRDPVWQFVGVVLGILAILASVAIYRLQRLNKRLAYEVVSRATLLTVREELENKVQVLYDGKPVQTLTVFLIRVWNAGTEPIKSSDFERPLSFATSATAQILTVAATKVSPESLTPELAFEAHSLTLSPMLLNPGDSLTLKVLVKDAPATLKPDARIVGVSHIQEGDGSTRRYSALAALGMFLFFAGAAAAGFYAPKPVEGPPLPLASKVAIGVAISGYVLAGYAAIRGGVLKRFRILVRRAKTRQRGDA